MYHHHYRYHHHHRTHQKLTHHRTHIIIHPHHLQTPQGSQTSYLRSYSCPQAQASPERKPSKIVSPNQPVHLQQHHLNSLNDTTFPLSLIGPMNFTNADTGGSTMMDPAPYPTPLSTHCPQTQPHLVTLFRHRWHQACHHLGCLCSSHHHCPH